ncbi:MAG: selenide, water dikinase SelD [Spirochaetaceae bacterium]|jgi:selenide,water dikinase|nr:selenide, water dikinase SelD [Spirochaetaceae bacterium]
MKDTLYGEKNAGTGRRNDPVSLLSNCTSGGCGAKIGPGELAGFLASLPVKEDPSLLVGFGGSDDAAVYRIAPDRALVSTVDFFSPMVEDPCLFGRIAAANALSDIYAMGGRPLYALNLVCFPQKLDSGILREILAGGAAKALEADTVIAGGHSIYDHEPKYGLAVTGIVDPGKVLRNNRCREGDALILTKALGVGLVMSALRAGKAPEDVAAAAAASMERLNRYAAEQLSLYPVHACTDVTGFGLMVHAAEMAGQDHTLFIESGSLPLLPGALDFAEAYYATAAGQRNRNYMEGKAATEGVSPAMQEIVFDPQTSGGLLIALPADHAQALCADIQRDDPVAAIIGMVGSREDYPVVLL